jgi:ornithine cyclodeaminase
VSVVTANRIRGLPTLQSTVMLVDAATGAPRAILDGACLTALRTGAAGGLAARLMAPETCEVVALYGAGVQARTQLEALLAERRPREIRVVARSRAHVEPFISASELPTGVSLVAADRDAASGAQIVICATTSPDPVFEAKDLGRDAHVTGVGSFRPETCEFPPEILDGARVVVDQREAALAESGEVIAAMRQGWLQESDLIEIGEPKARRATGDHITVFKSVGNGIQDLAVGCRVVERAEDLGIGKWVEL